MAQTHPSQKCDRMPGEHQRGIIRHIAIQVPYYEAGDDQTEKPVRYFENDPIEIAEEPTRRGEEQERRK